MNTLFAVGILMFLGTVVGHFRRRSGRATALAEYPTLAAELGLVYRASTTGGIGSLRGMYRGYYVIIDPDEVCRIFLRFVTEPLVDIRSYQRHSRAPAGLNSFHTSDSTFDGYFRQRYAGEQIRERLREQKNLQTLMGPFRVARRVSAIAVSSNGVECVFDFGRPPYIPASAVRTFLPAVVEVAQVIEAPFLNASEPGAIAQEPAGTHLSSAASAAS